MTKLEELIINRIQETGPISISTFMRECLLHPEHGFYTQRNVLGSQGDFITSPEISQMFGEILGLCLAQYWIDLDRPERFALVEFGPGSGTLILDILRAGSYVKGFTNACEIFLVEASSKLKSQQQKKLSKFNVNWINDDLLLPKIPTFFIANEFFDALPVKQYHKKNDRWYEVQVGLKNEQLCLGLSEGTTTHTELETRFKNCVNGDTVEISDDAIRISKSIGQIINNEGGCALIIDYGDWHSLGSTLQALKSHKFKKIFDRPGEVDLTCHVDFEALARNSGCAYSRLTTQGVFLERLGISDRANLLLKNSKPEHKQSIISAHRRLTHPDEMGTLFKVLGLYAENHNSPAGLVK
tara:strand:- start:299 stop:1363 length:1065 start_codon:yes stop_codon:yes gene_type:complete